MFEFLIFFTFAAIAIVFSLLVVLHRNPIVSALSLVVSFFSLAVMYVLLDAPFMAALQVIVYAGAIMVLFLFVIMLLNLGRGESDMRRAPIWVLGVVLVGVLASQLMPLAGYTRERLALEYTRSPYLADPRTVFDSTLTAAQATLERGVPGDIAKPLFEQYLIPFELTSVLLLAAIVGAVVLAKRRI